MSDYTPQPYESRARFIAGSIDLIQRRDGCTLAEAEETAIGEWERWMEWHNVRVRRGVVAEEPEWEYGATNVDDDRPVSVRDTLAEGREAQEFYTRERGRPTHLMTRTKAIPAGPWVPVKQEGAAE